MIDIGAFNGDSVLHFMSYPDIDAVDAYEPNTTYTNIWKAIEKHYAGKVRIFPFAVYTYKGRVEYTQRPDDLPLGSTIMKTKSGWGNGEIKKVICVDILDIIPDEPFCLKVDAEGAEYDILERLIDSGKSDLVDRLYVEWHDTKMSSDNSQRQINITNHFGDRVKQWL